MGFTVNSVFLCDNSGLQIFEKRHDVHYNAAYIMTNESRFYMSAPTLLNLLNSFQKRYKMLDKPRILSLFFN